MGTLIIQVRVSSSVDVQAKRDPACIAKLRNALSYL
jgi:hypothetical protein